MPWDDKTQAWALTVVVGVLGWLVKDFFFGVIAKRDDLIRAEWKDMLKGLWCPLFYWSGVINYGDGRAGWDGHGIAELEKLLAASAHLIPLKHYRTLMTALEHASGLERVPPEINEIKDTHDYIYGQIEALNYLLYRHPAGYAPVSATDWLAAPKAAFRFLSLMLLHLFVWTIIVVALGTVYYASTKRVYWPVAILASFFMLVLAVDWRQRFRLHRELAQRLKARPQETSFALLGRRGKGSPATKNRT
jgi:hypothetical protein